MEGAVVVGEKRSMPCDLHYVLYGKGPHKLLFIMGYCMTKETWLKQAEYFGVEHGDTFQVCIFDNRGYGDSVCPSYYLTTEMLAHDVYELLQHLNWHQPHVIGLSMGGMIAQELVNIILSTKDSPISLSSLTLAVTHAGGRNAVALPVRTWPKLLPWILCTQEEDKIKALVPLCYSADYLQRNQEELLRWHGGCYKRVGLRSLISQAFAVCTHYSTYQRLDQMKQSGLRVLVMVGTKDQMVNPINSYRLAQLLAAPLVEFEGCGHMINLEDAERFNRVVREHVLSEP
ncbi:AB hydrolase-1 domain-containing protein [Balamuthia mandrillaris]